MLPPFQLFSLFLLSILVLFEFPVFSFPHPYFSPFSLHVSFFLSFFFLTRGQKPHVKKTCQGEGRRDKLGIWTWHVHTSEKELATHSSILAWRIPWTEESGRPWGHKVRHDWVPIWWWWYIKQINNKDLQYSTGNSIQYLVITYNRRESKEKNMYIFIHTYVQQNHFALHLKLRQHCK